MGKNENQNKQNPLKIYFAAPNCGFLGNL